MEELFDTKSNSSRLLTCVEIIFTFITRVSQESNNFILLLLHIHIRQRIVAIGDYKLCTPSIITRIGVERKSIGY
jgi:hypothetical protein